MARRRLSPTIAPPPAHPDVPRAERSDYGGGAGLELKSALPGARPPGEAARAGAPIARVAAEAAGQAALDEVVETLRRAEAEGRMVIEIPLGEIDTGHLARDRVAPDAHDAEGEMSALVESLRAHGQRMPIEVERLDGGGGGRARYGLISGWRRLSALGALHAETGEDRFARVKALVRRPAGVALAYVAMVEENEIRLGLSQYERARIVALALERGVFSDEGEALRALFAGASRAKRSRIRSFMEIHRVLGRTLRFPEYLPERLGLRLVDQIRAGEGGALAGAIGERAPRTPEGELAVIEQVLDRFEGLARRKAEDTARKAAEAEAAREAERAGAARAERERAAVAETPSARPPAPASGSGPLTTGAGKVEAGKPEPGEAAWRWERISPGLELGLRESPEPELRLRGAGVDPALATRLRDLLGD